MQDGKGPSFLLLIGEGTSPFGLRAPAPWQLTWKAGRALSPPLRESESLCQHALLMSPLALPDPPGGGPRPCQARTFPLLPCPLSKAGGVCQPEIPGAPFFSKVAGAITVSVGQVLLSDTEEKESSPSLLPSFPSGLNPHPQRKPLLTAPCGPCRFCIMLIQCSLLGCF